MAYQGALGLDPAVIAALHRHWLPEPDLIILLEAPPAVRRQRRQARGHPVDAFEEEGYLQRVAAIYDRLTAPGLHRVDSQGTAAATQDRILALVRRCLDPAPGGAPS